MCRILLLDDPSGVDPNQWMHHFRHISQNSREFQGHGWGCAWLNDRDEWQIYRDIRPVWEDLKSDFPQTRRFLAHARSAFRDEGIVVENNMPFSDGDNVFIFNGELRGVRIKADGRIGAEKIFNYIRRLHKGDWTDTVTRATYIIDKRTRYIRAMNFFLASRDDVQICSWFNEEAEYFQLQRTRSDTTQIICSTAFDRDALIWESVANFCVQSLN
ncbi:MAG: hypothetical protein AAF402_06000 [Pseudomonadota bacterium]